MHRLGWWKMGSVCRAVGRLRSVRLKLSRASAQQVASDCEPCSRGRKHCKSQHQLVSASKAASWSFHNCLSNISTVIAINLTHNIPALLACRDVTDGRRATRIRGGGRDSRGRRRGLWIRSRAAIRVVMLPHRRRGALLFSHLLDTQHRIPRIVRFLRWRRGLHAL